MRKLVLLSLLFPVSLIWGLDNEESFRYVELLMETVAISPENNDCIDDGNSASEIEILFPTVNSLFEYEMPSNSCGFSWTKAEKQQAFDSFLLALGTTNHVMLSRKYQTAYDLVLPFCIDRHYTNSVNAAKNILNAPGSELKGMAIRLLLSLQQPTFEMNEIVLSVATNKAEMTAYERCLTVSAYVESLGKITESNHAVVTNAANLLFYKKNEIEHHIAIDRLMLFADAFYADSSNRMHYATEVLALPDISSDELAYFSAITNAVSAKKTHQ